MSRLIVSNIETQNIKFDSDTTAFTIGSGGNISAGSHGLNQGYKFLAHTKIDIGGSAAASIGFDDSVVTSAFNNYRIVINTMRPSNNGVQAILSCSLNNGSSTMANNQGQKTYFRISDGATGSESDNGANTHELATNVGNDQYDGITGYVDIYNTGNNSINLQRTMVIQSRLTGREDSAWYKWDGASYVAPGTRTAMINNFYLRFDAGNVADGAVTLYGLKES